MILRIESNHTGENQGSQATTTNKQIIVHFKKISHQIQQRKFGIHCSTLKKLEFETFCKTCLALA